LLPELLGRKNADACRHEAVTVGKQPISDKFSVQSTVPTTVFLKYILIPSALGQLLSA
jgi:hypothetical protein